MIFSADDLYPPDERKDGAEDPDWLKEERQYFAESRDANKDGKMDKKEMKQWLVPDGYNHVEAEAHHLMFEADSDKVEIMRYQIRHGLLTVIAFLEIYKYTYKIIDLVLVKIVIKNQLVNYL